MKAWIVPLFLAFALAATTASAAIAIRSFVDDMRLFTDAVAQGTVLSSRMMTFNANGETRVCGISYTMLVDDLMPAHRPQTKTFGMYFWSDQNHLRGPSGRYGLAAGHTYFFGVTHNAIRYHKLETLVRYEAGDDKPHPEIRACLGKLPQDFIVRPTEILGPPDDLSQQYIRIHATESVEDADIEGEYREAYKPSKPVPDNPNQVITSVDIELNEYNYDQRVPYAAVKRMFGLGESVKTTP